MPPTLFAPSPLRSERADDLRFRPLLFAYLDDLHRIRAHLPTLAGTGDAVAVARCAHRLAGTAGAYGYPEIGEAAHALELTLAAGEVHAAWGSIDALITLLDRALAGAPHLCTGAAA